MPLRRCSASCIQFPCFSTRSALCFGLHRQQSLFRQQSVCYRCQIRTHLRTTIPIKSTFRCQDCCLTIPVYVARWCHKFHQGQITSPRYCPEQAIVFRKNAPWPEPLCCGQGEGQNHVGSSNDRQEDTKFQQWYCRSNNGRLIPVHVDVGLSPGLAHWSDECENGFQLIERTCARPVSQEDSFHLWSHWISFFLTKIASKIASVDDCLLSLEISFVWMQCWGGTNDKTSRLSCRERSSASIVAAAETRKGEQYK